MEQTSEPTAVYRGESPRYWGPWIRLEAVPTGSLDAVQLWLYEVLGVAELAALLPHKVPLRLRPAPGVSWGARYGSSVGSHHVIVISSAPVPLGGQRDAVCAGKFQRVGAA